MELCVGNVHLLVRLACSDNRYYDNRRSVGFVASALDAEGARL